MEDMLKKKLDGSSRVNAKGVDSPETVLSSIPEGLEQGSSCEVIPSHALKPLRGQYRTGKTANGIRVFSSRNKPESEAFLLENFHAVDRQFFQRVTETLHGVLIGLEYDVLQKPCMV
jgi:hypothetical protein